MNRSHSTESIQRAITTLEDITKKLGGCGISAVIILKEQIRYHSTLVDPVEVNPAGVFCINVMAAEVPRGDMFKHFRIPEHDPGKPPEKKLVDVRMTINGVEVNFKRAIEDTWTRLAKTFDDAVLDKARDLVMLTKHQDLLDIIRRAERELIEELEKHFPNFKKEELE